MVAHDSQPAPQRQVTIPAEPGVVVGYDERAGGATLRWAAELAARLGGRLHVVHAIAAPNPEAIPPGPALGVPYPVVDPEATDKVRAGRERWLTDELTDTIAGLAPWSCAVTVGNAADVLARTAEETGASFVVVGARCTGLGAAMERLLSGSTVRELERELQHEHRGQHPGWALLVVPHDSQEPGT